MKIVIFAVGVQEGKGIEKTRNNKSRAIHDSVFPFSLDQKIPVEFYMGSYSFFHKNASVWSGRVV